MTASGRFAPVTRSFFQLSEGPLLPQELTLNVGNQKSLFERPVTSGEQPLSLLHGVRQKATLNGRSQHPQIVVTVLYQTGIRAAS
jgi:hypothetical protein